MGFVLFEITLSCIYLLMFSSQECPSFVCVCVCVCVYLFSFVCVWPLSCSKVSVMSYQMSISE